MNRFGWSLAAVFCLFSNGVWAVDPFFSGPVLNGPDAFASDEYHLNVANHATDPELGWMWFSELPETEGNSWIQVADNGNITGIPGAADVGTNQFTIMVRDQENLTATTTVQIVVQPELPVRTPYEGTNVLFIAIDDLRASLGAYDDPLAVSPNMDRLAEGGTVFLNNHCQWAVCGPSRASIMTSLMPEETGVMGFKNMRHILPDVLTLPQHFRAYGYETVARGKINDNRCVGNPTPSDPSTRTVDGRTYDDYASWTMPYERWPASVFSTNRSNSAADLPDTAYDDGLATQQGLALMDELAAGDKPFFLAVGYKKPHIPWHAPKRYWDLYNSNDFSVASFTAFPEGGTLSAWRASQSEVYRSDRQVYPDIPQRYPEPLPESKQIELIHGYYACVSFIDAQVGILLDRLEQLQLHTNTVVVLWSDHGYHLGDHNQWGKHTYMENATRSPMIIRNPFLTNAVSRTVCPTGLLDVYPTLCEMVGLPVPEQPISRTERSGRPLRGMSLVPLMDGSEQKVRDGIINYKGSGYAFRTERYRYMEWFNNGDGMVSSRDLYDYELDPDETVNLAVDPAYSGLIYQFSKAIRNARESAGCYSLMSAGALPLPGEDQRRLEGLGVNASASNGVVEIRWPGVDEQQYALKSSTNLVEGTWSVARSNLTGRTTVVVPDSRQEFFSIEVTD